MTSVEKWLCAMFVTLILMLVTLVGLAGSSSYLAWVYLRLMIQSTGHS